MSIYKHIALVAVAVMAAGFVGAEQSFESSVVNGAVKIESQVPMQKTLAIVGVTEAQATLVHGGGRGDHHRRRHNHRWVEWSRIGHRGACFAHYQAQHSICVASCVGNTDCVASCNEDYFAIRRRVCP